MNPRRVHQLIRENFPELEAAKHEWVNVADASGPRSEVIRQLFEQHVSSNEALVEVNRKLGDFLPKEEALQFVATHLCEGVIRVANREFSGFMVIAANGVATAWSHGANPSFNGTGFQPAR